MGENSLGSTLLDTTDARFANALSATPLAVRADYATTYGMENAERSTVINLLVRGRPSYDNRSDVQRNIEPYAEYLPEHYLRATGILNDTSS